LARIELARAAVEDLDLLIAVLSLPRDTRHRVRRSLTPLAEFPRLGPELTGRWTGMRFLLGPWRWMVLVYEYDEDADRVTVLTIQDARSSAAATSG
jgi:plasmid stabilization system protein ParE